VSTIDGVEVVTTDYLTQIYRLQRWCLD